MINNFLQIQKVNGGRPTLHFQGKAHAMDSLCPRLKLLSLSFRIRLKLLQRKLLDEFGPRNEALAETRVSAQKILYAKLLNINYGKTFYIDSCLSDPVKSIPENILINDGFPLGTFIAFVDIMLTSEKDLLLYQPKGKKMHQTPFYLYS